MIKLICVGSLKERYLKEAMNEYLKRLTKYTKIELIEVSDINNSSIDIITSKEKDEIINKIDKKDFIVTLEIEGKQMTSLQFSKTLEKTLINNANIVFIIGGSYGLHDDIKKMSDLALSFSLFTFPHQLFRVILLEQIYRAFKIIKNESYHK